MYVCVCVCGRKCLVMSWSWSLGRLTGPASCICRPDSSIEPLYSRHGRTPLQAARFSHSLLCSLASLSHSSPALPLSSLPLSCLPLVVHLFSLYLQHRSLFLNKSIEFINKQIIHNTIHNWAWDLGMRRRRRRRGRGMCGRGPCLNCAAYAYLATMSSSSSLSLSVIVTGVSNRLTTSNRIYFDLFIHMLPPPLSLCVSFVANGTRQKCQSVAAASLQTTTLLPYAIFRMASRCRRLLYEMPGISILIS